MSELTIFHEDTPGLSLAKLSQPEAIVSALAVVGVDFRQWRVDTGLQPGADSESVLAAYATQISALQAERGYTTHDVVRITPDHPERAALRQKFLAEHTHAEDEVRFFAEGSGTFYLHVQQRVYRLHCEQGDVLSVPANTPHWFDTGSLPHFTAVRLFTDPAGWIGHFTGSDIADRFVFRPPEPAHVRQPVSVVVCDLEGTVAPLSYVQQVLFPYARQRLAAWLQAHASEPRVGQLLADVATATGTQPDLATATTQLLAWSDEDKKITPLKTLQGWIWQEAYNKGELVAPLYPDVKPALAQWHAQGIQLAVYSSGSVAAQQQFFGHSSEGDLRHFFDYWFDTTHGGKLHAASYREIARAIGQPADRLLFLSDHPGEIAAAREAGWQVIQVVRNGQPPLGAIGSFTGLTLAASFSLPVHG